MSHSAETITPARLRWDENNQPYALDFEDIYFSRHNGLAESRAMFLRGNGLPGRFQTHSGACFTLVELGFGSALNFLAGFATFSAAGRVRRGLEAAGFAVEKVPGFAGKRDMLRDFFQAETPRRIRSAQCP